MPETPIATAESDIWAALQLDLEPNGESPETLEPVDAAFVRSLIAMAEDRVKRFTGLDLTTLDDIPANIAAAISLDVSVNYFNRLDPKLPSVWSELIAPHRQWGFGGSIEEDAS